MCLSIVTTAKMRTDFERNLVVNNKELKHSGKFNPEEIFSTINRALKARGYEKREKKTEEMVSSEERSNYIELRPIKEKKENVALMIKIKIRFKNAREVIKEVAGYKRKFLEGEVSIVFDSWILTDFQHHIRMQPLAYFLEAVINKFIYKVSPQPKLASEVTEDTAFIYGQLKRLFNAYTGKIESRISEEEVRKKMEEERTN